jgi:hypothetical protein
VLGSCWRAYTVVRHLAASNSRKAAASRSGLGAAGAAQPNASVLHRGDVLILNVVC